MKKIEKNNYSGGRNIIKKTKGIFLKCIRLGRKEMWIKPVLFGASMVVDAGTRILTSIKNIVSGRNTDNV
jgi:hypothetical protein